MRMLDQESFVDQDRFDLEMKDLFGSQWRVVCRQEKLADGKFVSETIGKESFVLFLAEDGNPRAFHNVCRHRGTRLIDAAEGTLKNHCIVCPYHAWTYDQDGCLVGAPNMLDDPDFDRTKFGLAPIETKTWNGFVLIRIGRSFHERTNQAVVDNFQPMMALADRLEPWRLKELTIAAEVEYQVKANWKILFQNYSECYHCPTVHPDLNQLTPYRNAANDLESGPILGGPMLLDESAESISQDGKYSARPIPGLNETQLKQVLYYTVFPGTFFSAHPDYVMIHYLRPKAPDETDVRCQFLVWHEQKGNIQDTIYNAVDFWDEVNRQDWQVCELTQKGVASSAYQPGPYSRLESMVKAFDTYYREQIEQILP